MDECQELRSQVLALRDLVIVSNRGPFSIQRDENGTVQYQRNGGGLVTALLGLANQVPSAWIACALNPDDAVWCEGRIPLEIADASLYMRFINPPEEVFNDYYQVIANPLLWFLQHSMWDFANAPTFTRETWKAWNDGYTRVNEMIADEVVDQVRRNPRPSIVMLQDYHLYLAPAMIRRKLPHRKNTVLTQFIHIPWPGPEDWGLLPAKMREGILKGLCAVDLLGFQTRDDALNFIRTCESLLPGVHVNYRDGKVTLRSHITYVRDFPISIDVDSLHEQTSSEEVKTYFQQLSELAGDRKIILRIDRTEPSKNIVRGFEAFDDMLEMHPEYRGNVQFWALMVPSRLEVVEYQDYLNSLMAAAGNVNARYGTTEWEPIRVLVGEGYARALAALQLYDVLLVNPIADGMNLVAKEGPTVNEKNGVLVLSERAGAHQQLGMHALVIAPCDVSATSDALHEALIMPVDDRQRRAEAMRKSIVEEDIHLWLCWQLDIIASISREISRGKGR